MAEVTVEQLAKTVGTDAAKLLSQMKDAGLPHKASDEIVSDDDKRTLLSHLKRSHGNTDEAPRKITLKRKSVSTLKTGGSSGKRTVNVEVRKKRTYVKRPEVEEFPEVEEEVTADLDVAAAPEPAAPAPEVPAAEEPASDPEPIEPVAEEPEVAEVGAATEVEPEIEEDPRNMDPEVLRQRAAARRRLEEEQRQRKLDDAVAARKAEEERKIAEREAAQKAAEEEKLKLCKAISVQSDFMKHPSLRMDVTLTTVVVTRLVADDSIDRICRVLVASNVVTISRYLTSKPQRLAGAGGVAVSADGRATIKISTLLSSQPRRLFTT